MRGGALLHKKIIIEEMSKEIKCRQFGHDLGTLLKSHTQSTAKENSATRNGTVRFLKH